MGSVLGRVVWECGGIGRHASLRNWFERVRVRVPPFLLKNLERKEEKDMITMEQKLALMKNRLATLTENGKNVKSPGVVRKLTRQIRNLENSIGV